MVLEVVVLPEIGNYAWPFDAGLEVRLSSDFDQAPSLDEVGKMYDFQNSNLNIHPTL